MIEKKKKPRAKKKKPQLFLLKKSDQFFLLPEELMDTMIPEEAYRLAMIANIEQRKQLMQDAFSGDHYIDSIKVVDGLEKSLSKLEALYPSIREQISNLDSRIAKC